MPPCRTHSAKTYTDLMTPHEDAMAAKTYRLPVLTEDKLDDA
jgi:hypothetical protein